MEGGIGVYLGGVVTALQKYDAVSGELLDCFIAQIQEAKGDIDWEYVTKARIVESSEDMHISVNSCEKTQLVPNGSITRRKGRHLSLLADC